MSHPAHAPALPYCHNCHFTLATPRPRYFVNLIAELPAPLFDLGPYREKGLPKYWRRVRALLGRKKTAAYA